MSRLYGDRDQPITFPVSTALSGLADGAIAISDIINNQSKILTEAFVRVQATTVASVDGTGNLLVGAVGAIDGGTLFPDSANQFLNIAGIMTANVDSSLFTSNIIPIAMLFNNILPEFWILLVKNQTGKVLSTAKNANLATYQGIRGSVNV